MKFWCKIWYFSIKKIIQNLKKVPTDLPYFFLVMIPEHNIFVLFWPRAHHQRETQKNGRPVENHSGMGWINTRPMYRAPTRPMDHSEWPKPEAGTLSQIWV